MPSGNPPARAGALADAEHFLVFDLHTLMQDLERHVLDQLEHLDLADLARKARRCTACPLYRVGTQTVFGEGAANARLVFVGEQPGDREDLEGRPFIGPAGRLLDEVLEEVGIARSLAYVTNAVKHFKWKPAGRRRLHAKPSAREVAACRPWLEAELTLLRPEVVVALGATAAQSLMGKEFRVTQARGKRFDVPWAGAFVATVHPSAILRTPGERRAAERAAFTEDLRFVARLLAAHGAPR